MLGDATLSWKRVRAAVAAGLLLAGLARSAGAAPPPAVGAVLQDRLVLLGRVVPLPPGDWIVLGHGYGRVEGPSPGPYGALLGVMLAHRQGERIDAMVLAAANLLPVEGGWGPPPQCGDGAMAFASAIKIQARNLSCAFVAAEEPAAALDRLPAWQAGAAEAARRGWALPARPLVAGMRAGDRHDVVDVRYVFAPGALADGDRLAALAPWSEAVQRRLEAGLQAPPPPGDPLPWPVVLPAVADEPSIWRLSFYKTVTNRVLQSSLTYATGFLVTGDPYTSAALTFWQAATHTAIYFGNELFWEWPTKPPALAFVAAEGRP